MGHFYFVPVNMKIIIYYYKTGPHGLFNSLRLKPISNLRPISYNKIYRLPLKPDRVTTNVKVEDT